MDNLSYLFSGLTIEKRDYQLAAVKEILSHLDNQYDQSVILNYPYGTGKTIIALLTFLAIKERQSNSKFIFTSAREAAALRCRQALEMAKSFGFVDKLGYLFDPKTGGKGLGLSQKTKMFNASTVIFAPITTLMNERFQIKSRLNIDILNSTRLFVIDEATDLVARSMSGFRLSKYFTELFQVRGKKFSFPILAMTGTRDQQRINSIVNTLGKDVHLMQRPDLSPYETITQVCNIRRIDYIKSDQQISSLMSKPTTKIQEILDPNLSRLEIVKMTYGGALDRLRDPYNKFPIKLGKYRVQDEDARQQLINAFILLFKLIHARLLLLESTPGEYLKYIQQEDNAEFFQPLIELKMDIISHRVDLPQFENPDEKTTRGLLHPKVEYAINLIHEHLVRGAKILLFTRYLALGDQLNKILKILKFPGVRYLSGKTPEDTRRMIIDQFRHEDINVLIFTPVGGRGLNLAEADIVIHLDITSNLDEMTQRRERARGCLEYVLVLEETSEAEKVKEYLNLTKEIAQIRK
ncbi:MAG: helicase-related protein [Candidatus Hodarchaeales archaeon]